VSLAMVTVKGVPAPSVLYGTTVATVNGEPTAGDPANAPVTVLKVTPAGSGCE
jgi:hypothetical protein